MIHSLFFTGAVFLLAGFVQGLTGFGSALVAIPLLVLAMDIKEAVPLCMLTSLVITSYLAFQLRHHLDRTKILPLCMGAMPGILFGATLLKLVPSSIIRVLLGIFLTAYALYSLTFTPAPANINKRWGYLAGFLSGAIGAAFSAGGPPTIIYATLSNWNKDTIKATLTGFFLFNSIFGAIAHLSTGLTTGHVFTLFLLAAPLVLIGTALGSRCYTLIKRGAYLKLIFVFLLAMGLLMIFGK